MSCHNGIRCDNFFSSLFAPSRKSRLVCCVANAAPIYP